MGCESSYAIVHGMIKQQPPSGHGTQPSQKECHGSQLAKGAKKATLRWNTPPLILDRVKPTVSTSIKNI